MYPKNLKLRIIGVREEEDYAFTDQWIEQEAQTRFGAEGPPLRDYKALSKEAPRKTKLLATVAIVDNEGKSYGATEHDVTNSEYPIRVGEEVAYRISSS